MGAGVPSAAEVGYGTSKTAGGSCCSLGPLSVPQASEARHIPHRSDPSVQDRACWKAVLQSAIQPCGRFRFEVGLARGDGALESYPTNVVVSIWQDCESTIWETHRPLLSLQVLTFELFPLAASASSRRAICSDNPGSCRGFWFHRCPWAAQFLGVMAWCE